MTAPAKDTARTLQTHALELLLRPIIRFCLKHSLQIQDLLNAAKRVFVDLADQEIRQHTKKVNVSRLSVVTGLYREEVRRIYIEGAAIETRPSSLLGRVVGQWEQDRRFRNKEGEPRVLSCDGEGSEFYNLVRLVSKNINPATVLFELERNGAVERTARGLKFKRPTFAASENKLTGYELLSRDLESLVRAVEENLEGQKVNLHIRTEFDNLYVRNLPQIREWLVLHGKRFHKEVRDYLSQFDKDINPDADPNEPAQTKVMLSTFSLAMDSMGKKLEEG